MEARDFARGEDDAAQRGAGRRRAPRAPRRAGRPDAVDAGNLRRPPRDSIHWRSPYSAREAATQPAISPSSSWGSAKRRWWTKSLPSRSTLRKRGLQRRRGNTRCTSSPLGPRPLTLANRTWARKATRVLAGATSYGPAAATRATNRRKSARSEAVVPARKPATLYGPQAWLCRGWSSFTPQRGQDTIFAKRCTPSRCPSKPGSGNPVTPFARRAETCPPKQPDRSW